MDSGSAECVAPQTIARNIPPTETEASRQGQTHHAADGGVIKNKGEKTVTMYSEDGDQFRARYQITDVTRPLNSKSRVCVTRETMCCSRRLVCYTHGSMSHQMRNGCDGQVSLFPGRSARVLRLRGTRGASGLCKTLREKHGSNKSLNVCPVVEEEMDDDVMDDKQGNDADIERTTRA